MQRRLAAIVMADVVGYSRLMSGDEDGTVNALRDHLAELSRLIADNGGIIVNTAGDSFLAEFASVVGAANACIKMQTLMMKRNAAVPPDRQIKFRMGLNQGEIVVDGNEFYGDGINVAARLQAIAEPDGIAISARVHEDVDGKLDAAWRDAGEQTLKNITRAVRVWHWAGDGASRPAARHILPPSDKPSIAVLPFDTMSAGDDTLFSDGISEDIITGLARFRSLFVIARNSSFAFRGQAKGVTEIGRLLGVSYLLEGSVRRSATRFRITAQLVEAATGAHIWADRYDRENDDVFTLQDEVATTIVSTLIGRIEEQNYEQSLRKPTTSLAAYELYQRGKPPSAATNRIPTRGRAAISSRR